MASVKKDVRYVNGKKVVTGRWRVAYRTPAGRQRTKVFKTAADARVFAAQVEVDKRKGDYIDPTKGKKLFGPFADNWLTTVDVRPSTRAQWSHIIRLHLTPHFGEMQLRAIDPTEVRQWHAALRVKKARTKTGTLSASTVAKAYSLLKRILAVAVEEGLITSNPCKVKKAGTAPLPEMRCPTPDQVTKLADAVASIQPKYRALVLLAGYGGLRWGEATALRRSHVDMAAGCVHVREQATEVDGRYVEVKPYLKTAAGRRTVYLPRVALSALREHLLQHVQPDPDALLFTAPGPCDENTYLRRSNFRQRVWLKATKVAGCEGVRFHDLRHAAATVAAQAGYTTAELMAHIGHASVAASMRYQHAADERMRTLPEKINALLETQVATGTGTDNVVPIR